MPRQQHDDLCAVVGAARRFEAAQKSVKDGGLEQLHASMQAQMDMTVVLEAYTEKWGARPPTTP